MPELPAPDVDLLLARPPRPLDGLSAGQWRALVEAAFRHGVLGAIAGRLPPGQPELRERFERLAATMRVRDAVLRVALDAVLATLGTRGVDVCPLKGPVLADRIHLHPALRPSGDVDLLVREEQLGVAVGALAAGGWRLEEGFRARYERRHRHHVTLLHAERPPVELHFRPQSGFGSRLGADGVLARARRHTTASGARVLVLAPEDELIFLALHAAQHLAERRGWVLDLLLLLEASPELDWGEVAERARAARCERAVGWVLRQVRALGGPVPAGVAEAVGPARARLGDALRRAVLARAKRDRIGQALRVAFEAAMCDGALLAAGRIAHEADWLVRRSAYRAAHRLRGSA